MCNCNQVATSYVANPNQLELDVYVPGNQSAYDDGFDTGVNWVMNYKPSGPWVYSAPSPRLVKDEKWQKQMNLHLRDKEKYDSWHAGFLAGLNKKMKSDPQFAKWWNSKRMSNTVQKYSD